MGFYVCVSKLCVYTLVYMGVNMYSIRIYASVWVYEYVSVGYVSVWCVYM